MLADPVAWMREQAKAWPWPDERWRETTAHDALDLLQRPLPMRSILSFGGALAYSAFRAAREPVSDKDKAAAWNGRDAYLRWIRPVQDDLSQLEACAVRLIHFGAPGGRELVERMVARATTLATWLAKERFERALWLPRFVWAIYPTDEIWRGPSLPFVDAHRPRERTYYPMTSYADVLAWWNASRDNALALANPSDVPF